MNEPAVYELVLRGLLSARLLAHLADDFAVESGGGTTRLIGEIRDPAHLHGVIAHLTSLAVEIVSIAPHESGDDR